MCVCVYMYIYNHARTHYYYPLTTGTTSNHAINLIDFSSYHYYFPLLILVILYTF